MPKYEYKTVWTEPPSGFQWMPKPPDLDSVLNEEGRKGWRVCEVVPNPASLTHFLIVFERQTS